ncbi:MAG: hypothetical protein IJQ80_08950 [Clostridia bacterium]|nr:hypothetical protein [Clostridia bacterium]
MEKKNQINLEKFLYVLRRRFVWILLIAITAGLAGGILTRLFVTPEYVSYATFYVQASSSQNQELNQQQINAAKSLVDTYIVFIKGNDFLDEVVARAQANHPEIKLNYNYIDVRERMSASSVSNTEVFKVSISDSDPKKAYALMEALTEDDMAPRMISDTSGGKVSVVDHPKLPTAPNSTGARRNAILAAVLFSVVSLVIFFLTELFDVTIYSEEDITEIFDYPIIGTIPNISPQTPSAKTQKGDGGKDDADADRKDDLYDEEVKG